MSTPPRRHEGSSTKKFSKLSSASEATVSIGTTRRSEGRRPLPGTRGGSPPAAFGVSTLTPASTVVASRCFPSPPFAPTSIGHDLTAPPPGSARTTIGRRRRLPARGRSITPLVPPPTGTAAATESLIRHLWTVTARPDGIHPRRSRTSPATSRGCRGRNQRAGLTVDDEAGVVTSRRGLPHPHRLRTVAGGAGITSPRSKPVPLLVAGAVLPTRVFPLAPAPLPRFLAPATPGE